MTAYRNVKELARQIKIYKPKLAAISDVKCYEDLKTLTKGNRTRILAGEEGLVAVAAESGADLVLSAIVGAAGLKPTLEAIHKGKDIALANKETMVMAGEVVTKPPVSPVLGYYRSIVSIARYSNACRAAPTPKKSIR